MSSSVMPWYTSVSFHTGFRVLRSVFVLSLFDCGGQTDREESHPGTPPCPNSSSWQGCPITSGASGERQGGILHKHHGFGDMRGWILSLPGVYSLKEREKDAQGQLWWLREQLSWSKGGDSGELRSCHLLVCLSQPHIQN